VDFFARMLPSFATLARRTGDKKIGAPELGKVEKVGKPFRDISPITIR